MTQPGCCVKIRGGLVLYQAKNDRAIIPQSIMEISGTDYREKSQEFLRTSGNHIAPKIDSVNVPTRHTSKINLGDT